MTEHIKNIDIKNFKCFKNFKADGLARVNLITGQNNVGKTAFLEAVYVNTMAQTLPLFFAGLSGIKFSRENINLLLHDEELDRIAYLEQSNGFHVSSNKHQTSFVVNKNNGVKSYHFKFNGQKVDVNSNDFSQEYGYPNNNVFIDNFGIDDRQIVGLFSNIQKLDKEEYLDKALNDFDSSITKFKTPNNQPQCQFNGQYLKLTELGDGTKHLISIITALFACQDSYVFIDEIDNGMHYTKLDDLWEIILTLSKAKNVQVFATTHSEECLKSYARVVKKLADKDITLIELGKSEGELKNIVFTADESIREISKGFDVRGWVS